MWKRTRSTWDFLLFSKRQRVACWSPPKTAAREEAGPQAENDPSRPKRAAGSLDWTIKAPRRWTTTCCFVSAGDDSYASAMMPTFHYNKHQPRQHGITAKPCCRDPQNPLQAHGTNFRGPLSHQHGRMQGQLPRRPQTRC